MPTLEQLTKDIEQIKERNRRVEVDKAWETSITRKIVVSILTYIVVTLFFFISNLPDPFIGAIVPSMAFLLSTLSVSVIKKWWIGNILKK